MNQPSRSGTRPDQRRFSAREWLVTNGIGGYASGIVDWRNTRSYHGLLIAALHAPIGRMVMWSHLFERVDLHELQVVDFRLELGLPVWRLRCRELEIERRIFLPHLQNAVIVTYRLIAGDYARLELEPALDFRKHGRAVDPTLADTYSCRSAGAIHEIAAAAGTLPALRLRICATSHEFAQKPRTIDEVRYPVERDRGYTDGGQLWSPGTFRLHLKAGETVAMIGSTEAAATVQSISPPDAFVVEQERRRALLEQAGEVARDDFGTRLVLAADQFLIRPIGRAEHGHGQAAEEITARTVIAGYHWFTDWGRDTMISFEGLTLSTRRFAEARQILLTFASYVRDGLIPNLFPDGDTEGLYHTADATLWFFHAVSRYVGASGDTAFVGELLPTLVEIVDAHLRGTKFNIHVDPRDGLLVQGEEGYQLTWMDAKVDGWVVTPRRGKAVEINALWYNALRLLANWMGEAGSGDAAARYEEHAERARRSFNQRFWFEEGGYLYDVVDGETGDDPACRPNQVFVISLDHPVLDQHRWAPVLNVIERELLTPVGLRSLSPRHPDYKPTYFGDLRTRDAAYHQGTVWGWLIGPFMDAWRKVHPDRVDEAQRFLHRFNEHLAEAGVGSISEIFDADEPHAPRGCIAQAWSVAEVLRCYCAGGDGIR